MKIIIEEKNNKKQKNNYRLNRFIDWLIYMVGYAIVLITASILGGNSFIIEPDYFGLWGLLAAIIIYFLNKTIKPVLIFLTLPLTIITLGLFYPFINVIILMIVGELLPGVTVNGIIIPFFIAILISLMNELIDNFVADIIIRRKRHE